MSINGKSDCMFDNGGSWLSMVNGYLYLSEKNLYDIFEFPTLSVTSEENGRRVNWSVVEGISIARYFFYVELHIKPSRLSLCPCITVMTALTTVPICSHFFRAFNTTTGTAEIGNLLSGVKIHLHLG